MSYVGFKKEFVYFKYYMPFCWMLPGSKCMPYKFYIFRSLLLNFFPQVPSVEVNALMKTFKMKPFLFPVCTSVHQLNISRSRKLLETYFQFYSFCCVNAWA